VRLWVQIQLGVAVHDLRPDKVRWLDEAIALVPDVAESRETVREYLQPLLKRCRAKSRSRFWLWIRLQLAKTGEAFEFLEWMQESRLPREVARDNNVEHETSEDGSVEFFNVATTDKPIVWQVPVQYREWALAQFPLRLVELPPLESETHRELRRLKRRLRDRAPFLTQGLRARLDREIQDLEQQCAKPRIAPPRYELRKGETVLHRVFMQEFHGAAPEEEVRALDGNYLNYATTTARIESSVISDSDTVVLKGRTPIYADGPDGKTVVGYTASPLRVEVFATVPNLVTANDTRPPIAEFYKQLGVEYRVPQQTDFEGAMVQRHDGHDRVEAIAFEQPVPVPERSVRPAGASPSDDEKNAAQAKWDEQQRE